MGAPSSVHDFEATGRKHLGKSLNHKVRLDGLQSCLCYVAFASILLQTYLLYIEVNMGENRTY